MFALPNQLPYLHWLLVTANRNLSERNGIRAVFSERIAHRGRDQQLRIELLVQRLETRRKVHGVADDGIFLSSRRANVAGHHFAEVNADADTQRPVAALI